MQDRAVAISMPCSQGNDEEEGYYDEEEPEDQEEVDGDDQLEKEVEKEVDKEYEYKVKRAKQLEHMASYFMS